MNDRQISGVSKIATMKETARAIATVIGRAAMNSPAVPVRISSGRKEAMIVTVAVSTGTMTSVALLQAASIRGTLWSRSST